MKQLFVKVLGAAAILATLNSPAIAQKSGKDRNTDNDEIVIKSKDNKDVKVTVEIKDGEVKVDGKPLAEYNNDDVQVMKRRNLRPDVAIAPAPPTPPSPFRGGTWNFNDNEDLNHLLNNSNKAFLGVTTETATNGVEVTGVTKGSAAEKSGLKEGDVITRVNDTKIESPANLSKTIAGFKPDEKVEIAYRRDKKELKTSVTLGKREGNLARAFDMNRNFNFDLMTPDGSNFIMRGGGPKLGIKAQDTDDGKGVKVLDVDDESNAAKAGIKQGDIVTELDGKSVNSAMELVEAAKNARDKNNIKVKLNRDGKSQEVEIKVPKKLKTANL